MFLGLVFGNALFVRVCLGMLFGSVSRNVFRGLRFLEALALYTGRLREASAGA